MINGKEGKEVVRGIHNSNTKFQWTTKHFENLNTIFRKKGTSTKKVPSTVTLSVQIDSRSTHAVVANSLPNKACTLPRLRSSLRILTLPEACNGGKGWRNFGPREAGGALPGLSFRLREEAAEQRKEESGCCCEGEKWLKRVSVMATYL